MNTHDKLMAHAAGEKVVDGVTFETPMVPQTHQQVVDAMAKLAADSNAAYQATQTQMKAQREVLQAQCAAIGHVFGATAYPIMRDTRLCVFCYAAEPTETAKEAQP